MKGSFVFRGHTCITFELLNKNLYYFLKKHHFHARATDDLFVMVIECTDKTNTDDLQAFLSSNGALETKVEVAEDGWWLGRYDKDEMPFEEKQIVAA